MSGEERRRKIVEIVEKSEVPVSATFLSKELGVSRQIIVGDVALLRAQDILLIATNRGYIMEKTKKMAVAEIKLKNRPEDMYDLLCTIVDMGGRIKNDFIISDLYGKVCVELNINNRAEAQIFSEKYIESGATLLSALTKNIHFHTVEADNELVMIRVQKALNEKGYLTR